MTTDRPLASLSLSGTSGREITPLDSEVVELALLLPRWQALALEDAAHQRGLTAGQMLRKLIGVCLCGPLAAAT